MTTFIRKISALSSICSKSSPLVLQSRASYHTTIVVLKDKPFTQPSNGPRKSKFAKPEGEPVEKAAKSAEEKEKLDKERKERELKKKETRAKQIEIQKKRDAEKQEKAAKTAAKISARQSKDDEN